MSFGGPGGDNFIFHPGVGVDTTVNFNPQHDTIEFENFTNFQTVQQLQSLMTNDAHGDAVINLGNHDSITLANVQVSDLHASSFIFQHAILA